MSHRSRPGDRVFAVRDADQTTVHLYGRGVYAGDFPRPDGVGFLGTTRAEAAEIVQSMTIPVDDYRALVNVKVNDGVIRPDDVDKMVASYAADIARPLDERVDALLANPRIDLDNGTTVWGAQCWWGPEAALDAWAAGREIVEVALT